MTSWKYLSSNQIRLGGKHGNGTMNKQTCLAKDTSVPVGSGSPSLHTSLRPKRTADRPLQLYL